MGTRANRTFHVKHALEAAQAKEAAAKVREYPPGQAPWERRILADIDKAIAEGRHSHTFQTVCSGCGEWVSEILWVSPQNSRYRLCRKCSPRETKDPPASSPPAGQGGGPQIPKPQGTS